MNTSQFNRRIREAQRKVEREFRREIDRVNRENKRVVDQRNRKVDAHNKRQMDEYNRRVEARNRRAEEHNKKIVAEINRRLNSPRGVRVVYEPIERALVDRVHEAIKFDDGREYDVFLSYARIDGEAIAKALVEELKAFDVSVWFDSIAVLPGKSQSLQMDAGLRKANAGIALLTPAYLAGRFWTQRELGALLHKPTLIPVLHEVTFDDVKEYSGILPDLAGFTTAKDDIAAIAEKIAPAVRPENWKFGSVDE